MRAASVPRRWPGMGWWALLALCLGVATYASLALLRPATIDFLSARSGWLRSTLVWHALSGAVALALGPWQLSSQLRNRHPRWHRLGGRIYVGMVLLAAVSGLMLAPTTRGGAQASAGFLLLSLLWLSSTTFAVSAVRRGDLEAHRAWMLRSFALTFAAVTLRILLGLGIASGLRFDDVYALAAWLSWVPNLLVVEWALLSPDRFARKEPIRCRGSDS